MPPAEFWQVTPREVRAVLDGVRDRLQSELRRDQQLIYAQAVLNSHAFHKGKMPDFERFFGIGRGRQMTGEEMLAALRDHGARAAAAGLKGV